MKKLSIVVGVAITALIVVLAIRKNQGRVAEPDTGAERGRDSSDSGDPAFGRDTARSVDGRGNLFAGESATKPRVQGRSGFSSVDAWEEVPESSSLDGLLGGSGDSMGTGERVRELQGMRGSLLSDAEREAALEFLAGRDLPEDMTRGSIDWVSDELLTVLRLQEPRWEGLAGELGAVAFQPGTNPVTRDYIMQHLGHIWEETGARKEIDKTLWRAVGSTDETTPGTALIALNRGYVRDGNEKGLVEVRDRALKLAQNTGTPLATRVTALSIAGEGGGAEVREFATKVLGNQETPLILRKVAERTLEVGP